MLFCKLHSILIVLQDDIGTNADSALNPVIKAVPVIRKTFPDLIIACDVSIYISYISYVICL